MTRKWNMIVDISRCENCRGCFLAVKDEHIGNDFPGYAAPQPAQGHNWVDIEIKERGRLPIVEANFMPVMCNHCDDAPCMKAAKDGAVSKRADGIVIIDPKKSKGQKAIADACPYDAVYWNEDEQIPQAWIFDAHLLDQGWAKPRIETICPTGVYKSIKVDDQEMRRIKEQEGLEVLHPEYESKPRVYYKNLHLMTQCFVAGTVVVNVEDIEDCAENAEVILKQNGSEVARATTDFFGEFKIDKLEKNSGQYQLEVDSESLGRVSLDFDLGDESLYLGTMTLADGVQGTN